METSQDPNEQGKFGRRRFLLLTGSAAAAAVVVGCGGSKTNAHGSSGDASEVGADSAEVARVEAKRRRPSAPVRDFALVASPYEFDLGGKVVKTWAFSDQIPGPLLRANVGDVLRVGLKNELPESTAIHWHGLAIRNDMDGVPGLTEGGIKPRSSFQYEFALPDSGTYFFHPHVGLQLDRGLYAPLIVDDPTEPGAYDREWIIVLDDWIDGVNGTPDDELVQLRTAMTGSATMAHNMTTGPSMNMRSALLGGDAGDVRYPYYLLNGRTNKDPETLTVRPGDRVRIRVINAGSDTAFVFGIQEHQMTITHADGLLVADEVADRVLIGMGERFDAMLTAGDGAFVCTAVAEGKGGEATAVLRTSPGARVPVVASPPTAGALELASLASQGKQPVRSIDRQLRVALGGSMSNYRWTINEKAFPKTDPLRIREGEGVRMTLDNRSTMWHPMHLHGHTFTLPSGVRKDTVIVKPGQRIPVEFTADNPGQWMLHCHNVYHQEAGMSTVLSYRK